MARLSTKEKLNIIMNDFPLFAKNFITIIDNNGDQVKFNLNNEQVNFIENKEKFNIILKGRQIGFTTLSLAYMLWSAITKPDSNYLIMTQHGAVTKSLFTKLKKMYKFLPTDKYPDLFPKQLLNNRDELYFDNGSRIVVATAGGEDSISGNTFQFIHLSEMAKYNAEQQEEILATAIPALAKNDSSMIVIESTAMGFNYYQELFQRAYKGRESVWKAFFYSWLSDAYVKQFSHTFKEAEKWFRLHNKGERMTEKHLEHDEKVLREKHKATYTQLMFRRYYIETNSVDKFRREFPTTPDEAFLETTKSVFDMKMIVDRLEYCISPLQTNEVYDELDNCLKPYINKGLLIFHKPKKNVKYFGGVDTASGSAGDYSTIAIYDEEGQQVASFNDNKTPVYKFAQVVNSIGRFFNYAFLCIERNSYGLPLIERLRKDYEYMNLYKQKIFDQKGKKKMQLGFMTTSANKSILVSDFKEQFELGLINIECKETLQQMQIFQEKNGKTGNIRGANNYDDLVIASALSVQAQKIGKWYV